LTGHGELLLAEFKYGLEPKETFSAFVDQTKSHRAFYWLKKSLFPHVYWNYMVSFDLGIWARVLIHYLFRSKVNGLAQKAFPVHHTRNLHGLRRTSLEISFNDPRL